jgi:hypothetical protein
MRDEESAWTNNLESGNLESGKGSGYWKRILHFTLLQFYILLLFTFYFLQELLTAKALRHKGGRKNLESLIGMRDGE